MSQSASDHTAARVLLTLVRDPKERMVTGADERALDALVRMALKEVPEVAGDLFAGGAAVSSEQIRAGKPKRESDIVITAPAQDGAEPLRLALIEVKGRRTPYNDLEWLGPSHAREEWTHQPTDSKGEPSGEPTVLSIDAYWYSSGQDAQCFVLMPAKRSRKVGEAWTADYDRKGRKTALLRDHYSADSWQIKTFEEVADALEVWGIEQGNLTDSDVRLAAALMRVDLPRADTDT